MSGGLGELEEAFAFMLKCVCGVVCVGGHWALGRQEAKPS